MLVRPLARIFKKDIIRNEEGDNKSSINIILPAHDELAIPYVAHLHNSFQLLANST